MSLADLICYMFFLAVFGLGVVVIVVTDEFEGSEGYLLGGVLMILGVTLGHDTEGNSFLEALSVAAIAVTFPAGIYAGVKKFSKIGKIE